MNSASKSSAARGAIVAAALAVLLLVPSAVTAATVVLDGSPSIRVDSDATQTRRRELTGTDRAKARVRIERVGDKYFWVTRGDRELIHHEGGIYHYFIDPLGGGYVKVVDWHDVPAADRPKGPRYSFYEHVSLGEGTITYWGGVETAVLGVQH